jgi:hypothetical protein
MTVNEAAAELGRIRQACEDLGADQEMTTLVLASHRRDRSLLDVMVADGGDLVGYVRHKIAVWEAILTDPPDDPTILAFHPEARPTG